MREIRGGNAGSGIAHADLGFTAPEARADFNPGAARRVFKRIVEKVLADLGDLEGIDEHQPDRRVDRERNDMFARDGTPANIIDEAGQEVGQGRRFAAQARVD